MVDYLFIAGVDRFATKFISYGVPNPCNLYNMLTISTLYSLSLSFKLPPFIAQHFSSIRDHQPEPPDGTTLRLSKLKTIQSWESATTGASYFFMSILCGVWIVFVQTNFRMRDSASLPRQFPYQSAIFCVQK